MAEETIRTAEVTVRFDGQRCIHARHCVLDRPDVFVPNVQGEWIHPERATVAEVVEIAHNCPSGAIRCERPDGSPLEQPPRVNTVRVRENGPLAVRADIALAGQPAGCRLTLCRCGASSHKPYCDGSHATAGFVASGEPAAKESAPLAARNGPLAIQPLPDGPLHVQGSVEVVTGTGKTIHRTSEAWLCRCGHSKDKPYCDGSHRAAGFRG